MPLAHIMIIQGTSFPLKPKGKKAILSAKYQSPCTSNAYPIKDMYDVCLFIFSSIFMCLTPGQQRWQLSKSYSALCRTGPKCHLPIPHDYLHGDGTYTIWLMMILHGCPAELVDLLANYCGFCVQHIDHVAAYWLTPFPTLIHTSPPPTPSPSLLVSPPPAILHSDDHTSCGHLL